MAFPICPVLADSLLKDAIMLGAAVVTMADSAKSFLRREEMCPRLAEGEPDETSMNETSRGMVQAGRP